MARQPDQRPSAASSDTRAAPFPSEEINSFSFFPAGGGCFSQALSSSGADEAVAVPELLFSAAEVLDLHSSAVQDWWAFWWGFAGAHGEEELSKGTGLWVPQVVAAQFRESAFWQSAVGGTVHSRQAKHAGCHQCLQRFAFSDSSYSVDHFPVALSQSCILTSQFNPLHKKSPESRCNSQEIPVKFPEWWQGVPNRSLPKRQ